MSIRILMCASVLVALGSAVGGQSRFEIWKNKNDFPDRWEGVSSPTNVSALAERIDVVSFHRSRQLQVPSPKELAVEFESSTAPIDVVVREEELDKAYYMQTKAVLQPSGRKYRFTWPTAPVILPKQVKVPNLLALATLASARPGHPVILAPVDLYAAGAPSPPAESSRYEVFVKLGASASSGKWTVFDRCPGGTELASGSVASRAGGRPARIPFSVRTGWSGTARVALTFTRADRKGDMQGEFCFDNPL